MVGFVVSALFLFLRGFSLPGSGAVVRLSLHSRDEEYGEIGVLGSMEASTSGTEKSSCVAGAPQTVEA